MSYFLQCRKMKNTATLSLIVFLTIMVFASTAVLQGKTEKRFPEFFDQIDGRDGISDERKACLPESYGPCTSNGDCCQDVTDWAGRKLGCYTHYSRVRCMTMRQCLFDSGVGLDYSEMNK